MADDLQVNIPPDVEYKSKLVDVLYADPKMRPKLLQLVKEYAPNVRIPEIDSSTEVLTALQPHLDAMKADRDERQADRAERQADRAREALLARGDVSAAELPDIEKVMQERGISRLDTAADFYTQVVRPAARPRGAAPSPFTMPGGADMKGLLDHPKRWAQEMAYKTWDELQQSRR